MKKFIISIIFILVAFLFSCNNAYDVIPDLGGSQADWAGETVKKSYSASDYMFEVTDTTRNLDITLPNGEYDVYVVQINNSDYTVRAIDNQYVVDAGFLRSTRNANGEAGEFLMESELDEIDFLDIPEDDGRVKRVHFVDNFVPPPFNENAPSENSPSLRSASYLPPMNPSYSPTDVGKITKDIFVDIDPNHTGNISSFTQKKATLEAVGNHCYVWVVNDYLLTNDSDPDKFKKIKQEDATQLKSFFDSTYEYVRYVFGEESDDLIVNGARVPMNDKKVNIVVYDILEDATPNQTGGVLGYFARKDYYPYDNDSNEGKYFYIDSYFNKKYRKETLSTLVHEFQHMISFNVKYLQQNVYGYSGYNEMLSMLCEDMLQKQLNISDLESPKGRFLNFLTSYYKYGIFDNPDDAYFYAVTYMFGAFLARNYGGAKLVKKMARNAYGNAKSITEALHEMGYPNKSFETVFKEYAKALVLPNQTDKTFNKDAPTDSSFAVHGYNFPMTGFNIFNFEDKDGNLRSMHDFIYPIRNNGRYRKDLHGKGIVPYYVGKATFGGELRLTFSKPENPNSKVFVLVSKK